MCICFTKIDIESISMSLINTKKKIVPILNKEYFESKLKKLYDFHNIWLTAMNEPKQNYNEVIKEIWSIGQKIIPFTKPSWEIIYNYKNRLSNILFEGAQGTFLDIDHGTYPFVTSSTTTAGSAASGSGYGPLFLDYVLGITKAYTTRVGSGPFPTELFDKVGQHLAHVGAEKGATTGRDRRCGWFDAIAAKRSIRNSGISSLCVTKLDVLDGLSEIKVCTGYKLDGKKIDDFPLDISRLDDCEPVYKIFDGWESSTIGTTSYDQLPSNACHYLEWIEDELNISIDIISTGPDREQTIIKRNPFS